MTNNEKIKAIMNWDENFLIEESTNNKLIIATGFIYKPFRRISYEGIDAAVSDIYDTMISRVLSMCDIIEKEKHVSS